MGTGAATVIDGDATKPPLRGPVRGLFGVEPVWLVPHTAQITRKAHEKTRGDEQGTPTVQRRQRKSFSGFHSVSKCVRSMVRRTSISFCIPSRRCNHSITDTISDSEQTEDKGMQPTGSEAPIWPRRTSSLAYSRRLSTGSAASPPSYHACNQSGSPPPSYRTYDHASPQTQLIANRPLPVPFSVAGGAAARAAAAATHVRRLHGRVPTSTIDQVTAKPTNGKDSESGIGVEVQYSATDLAPNAAHVVRKGM